MSPDIHVDATSDTAAAAADTSSNVANYYIILNIHTASSFVNIITIR